MGENKGIRTRMLLVAAMALIIAGATFGSLLIVRHQLEKEVTQDLGRDLAHSVATFQNLQAQRLNALERENALMADLPSLKALMTTSDKPTIEDAGVRFWKVSDSDLFALADNQGHVVAAYAKGLHGGGRLAGDVDHLFDRSAPRYLVSSDRLYACSVLPLYAGTEEDGVLLGYVVSGFQIGPELLRQISQATAVEAVFLSHGQSLASTLDDETLRQMERTPVSLEHDLDAPVSIRLGNERYISATRDLTAGATAPLQLVVLKAFAPAEASAVISAVACPVA